MELSLISLFANYSWHYAIVGLIGVVLIGIITYFVKKVYTNKTGEDTTGNTTYDTYAVLISLGVALILGCLYTFIADKCGWLYEAEVTEEGIEVVQNASFLDYVSGFLITWVFQSALYTIWKKLGTKKILQIIWNAIKTNILKRADADGDGEVDAEDLTTLITGYITDGTLNVEDILATVNDLVEDVADDVIVSVIAEAGEAATTVNTDELIDDVSDAVSALVDEIPNNTLADVASALLKKAQAAASTATVDVLTNAATTSTTTVEETATEEETTEETASTGIMRPVIKF